MKNKFLLFFLALSMSVFAGERSAQDAAALAAEFMNQQVNVPARKASVGASAMQLSHTRAKLNSTEPAFYVFNQASKSGYVVVSADDRTEDVLMYSDEGTLDVEKANPNLQFWLRRLQEEISAVNDENGFTAAEKQARKAVNVTAIAPLLKNADGTEITWYQESPYWNQCPKKSSSYCLTGCVATAAAQIMYKWRHPVTGTGSHSYIWNSQTLSKDFSTVTFDWTNMLPAYDGVSSTTAQKTAVATLMYCCGVACEMDYGTSSEGGSGAYTDMMGYGLTTYFGYKAEKFITMYSKSKYGTAAFSPAEYSVTRSSFETYFNADLEAGRPIIMGGGDNTSGGHEFVCDGRNSSGYFHINWGWEGEGNNYCLLSSLKPSGYSYGFSANLDAMIGLEPATTEPVAVTGVTVAPTSLTLELGANSTLTATVAPSNATDKSVSWSSSDSKIASVSATGVVTAVAEGSATITVTTTDGSKKATCAVTVEKAAPVGSGKYVLVKDASTLQAGDKLILATTITSGTSTSSFAAGAMGSVKYFTAVSATVANEIITADDAIIITLGGQKDAWTFTTSEGLVGTKAAKALVLNDKDATTTWTIAISEGNATITSTEATYGSIQYNSGSPRFLNYTTTQKPVQLYKLKKSSGGDPVAVTAITAKNAKDTVAIGDAIKLNYTITPDSATDQRVEFAITSGSQYATLDGSTLTGVAAGNVVVTVTALDSVNTGKKLTATYNIVVKAAQLNTCAEANAAASGASLKLNEVTVVYVNGAYVYVKDASGSTLVYQSSTGLKAGDVVAGIKGTASPYKGLPELKPTNDPADWTITSGDAPAIPAATAAPTAAEVNTVMVWKGVSGMSGSFTTASYSNLTGSFKGEDVLFRNNFKLAQTFESTKTYNITGAVAIYTQNETTTIQVYFISAEEVVAPTIPSDELLNSYAEAGQNLVYAIYVDDDIKCNDIVLVGTYNNWGKRTGSKELADSCSKFVAVDGYDNWYVCCVVDASEDIQAKPVQLDGSGKFSWDYQVGKLEQEAVVRGTATIVPGYSNECDIKAIDDSTPLLINVSSWKTNPCAAVYHDYVISLVSPDCNEEDYVVPAISGGFNLWAQQAMEMDDDATYARQQEGLPGAVFTVTAHAVEGTQFKFRSSEEWGKDWTNELKEYDEGAGEWTAYNGGQNFTFDETTELTFDLGDPTWYSWTNCEKPVVEDSMFYYITVTFPECEDATPQIIGDFDGWSGTTLTPTGNPNEYNVTILTVPSAIFNFNDAVLGWDNVIQQFDGSEWNMLSNIKFGETAQITLDFSDAATYRWQACPEPVGDGIVFNYESITDTAQVKSNVSVVLAKGTGTNAPAWNTTSSHLRLYAKNTITVKGKNISKVELTCTKGASNRDYADLTASEGVLISGGTSTSTTDEKTDTWTGKSNEIVFTVGTGQRAVKKIVVYVNGQGSDSINYTIIALLPECEVATPNLVGSFCGWTDGVVMSEVSANKYVATVKALPTDEFKINDAIFGWDNEIQQFDGTTWMALTNSVFGNDSVISIDYSADTYRWMLCAEPDYYTLTITSADPALGYVIGGGEFEVGAEVSFAAVCTEEGYVFSQWSDGKKAAGRTVTMNSDITLTAYFAEAAATDTVYINMIEVNSLNPTMGSAVLQVAAIAEDGYKFTNWTDANTDNPRIIEDSDEPRTFTAVFEKGGPTSVAQRNADNQSDVKKRIVNERLVIERNKVIYDATGVEVK